MDASLASRVRSLPASFGGGAIIGVLGGLIGLGVAEVRLPLPDKAMSLVVAAAALPFRASTVPFGEVAARGLVIMNIPAGSLFGAWFGAGWATRLRSESLYRVIVVLLTAIAVVLLVGHRITAGLLVSPYFVGTAQAVAGVIAGLVIDVAAALLGVAGGELLIPTLVRLFGADNTGGATRGVIWAR